MIIHGVFYSVFTNTSVFKDYIWIEYNINDCYYKHADCYWMVLK